jgi:hypothetical protein
MAKDNDKVKAAAGNAADWLSDLFGQDGADFVKTGELTPMYTPEGAFENKWPAVGGKLDRVIFLPKIMQTDGIFEPVNLLIDDLVAATKGMKGAKQLRTECDVAKGGRILIPVTGQLRVNRELIVAALDPDYVYRCAFRVTGREKVNNQPSKMFTWDVYVDFKNRTPRKGTPYALPQHAIYDQQERQFVQVAPGGNNGVPYDPETGEIIERGAIAGGGKLVGGATA